MKPWSKIFFIGLFSICLSFSEATAGVSKNDSVCNTEYSGNLLLTSAAEIQSRHSDNNKYIKRYSSKIVEGDYKHTLVPGTLLEDDKLLSEINNRSKVKVYVLLINGISHPHYNVISDWTKDFSQVLDWSKNQKSLESYSLSDIAVEAKDIAEKLSAKEASYLKEPAVFCSMVEFDILHGYNKGKKITLYYSTAYGFEDSENYLKVLDDNIKNASWTNDTRESCSQLVSIIRQRAQAYIAEKITPEELALVKTRLLDIHSRSKMEFEIKKIDRNLILGFEDNLRGHVVATLLGPAEPTNSNNTGGATYIEPNTTYVKSAIDVLENIEDGKLNEWFAYIKSSNPEYGNKTIYQKIISSVDGVIKDDDLLRFVSLITKQLKKTPDFKSKIDRLFDQEDLADRVIVWDNSYTLKVSTPPVGTNDYEVDHSEDGKIIFTREYVESWTCTQKFVISNFQTGYGSFVESCKANWESDREIILDPFDLVVFIDRSDLALLDGVAGGNAKVVIVPAIMLKYAQDQKIKTNLAAGFFIGLDVITIVTPIGAAYNLAKISHRIYRVLDWAAAGGAAANLIVNVNNYDPKYGKAIAAYNNITAAFNIGTLAGVGARKLSSKLAGDFVSEMNQPGVREGLESLAKGNDKVAERMQELERELVLESKVGGKLLITPKAVYSAKYGKDAINTVNGFSDNIASLANQNGIDVNAFKSLQQKSFEGLSLSERVAVNKIRNLVPIPDVNTILQKVIHKSSIGDYLNGTYSQVGGYVTTFKDAKHLTTYEEIYYGMRLDYNNTKFSLSDGSCGVIRYKVSDVSSIIIPKSPANGGTISDPMPFTGHGFTSGQNGTFGVPELKSDYLTPQDGAELWEVFSDGTEVLRGVFSISKNIFVAP